MYYIDIQSEESQRKAYEKWRNRTSGCIGDLTGSDWWALENLQTEKFFIGPGSELRKQNLVNVEPNSNKNNTITFKGMWYLRLHKNN